ncbi:DMT family transporter [Pseudoalteromonas sp. BZB3]|uniref:DMT family transporter n=1 Tax=Pseudoalteromonas sp. BZB3 TaxID=3136670 RepID=UPI0032C43EA8
MNSLGMLAIIAGGCIAIQAAMNARLGVHLNSALLATGFAFLASFALITSFIVLSQFKTLQITFSNIQLTSVPWYLWFSCTLSVVGVGAMYWLIPKMGAGMMMSYALTGQLVIAMLISHFGLFESPQKLITSSKLLGSALLIVGIILINRD